MAVYPLTKAPTCIVNLCRDIYGDKFKEHMIELPKAPEWLNNKKGNQHELRKQIRPTERKSQ